MWAIGVAVLIAQGAGKGVESSTIVASIVVASAAYSAVLLAALIEPEISRDMEDGP